MDLELVGFRACNLYCLGAEYARFTISGLRAGSHPTKKKLLPLCVLLSGFHGITCFEISLSIFLIGNTEQSLWQFPQIGSTEHRPQDAITLL